MHHTHPLRTAWALSTRAAGLGRLKPLAAALALGVSALGGTPARAEFPFFPTIPYEVDVYWSFAAGCAPKDFFDGCWGAAPPTNTRALLSSHLNFTKTLVISNPGSSAATVDFLSASRDPSDVWGHPKWELVVDGNHPGASAVRISRGTLELAAHEQSVVIGSAGHGQLDQTGGKVNANRVYLGGRGWTDFERPGLVPNGVYNLSGGELAITGGGALAVGYRGIGTFNQSGNSTVTIDRWGALGIGTEAGSAGIYNMQGGVLRTPNIVGGQGSSTFNFNGGTINTGYGEALSIIDVGTMRVAGTQNARAAFAPPRTDSINLGVLDIGGGQDSIGMFRAEDGRQVRIGTLRLAMGFGSQASFTQSAGSLHVGTVENGFGSSTLALDGGVALSFVDKIGVDALNVGRSLPVKGVLTHLTVSSGQQVDVTDTLTIGSLSSGQVTVQSGGKLASTQANLADSGGRFASISGTAVVTGAGSRWQNSGDLNLGGTATAAGGIGNLTIADGGEVIVGQTLRLWGHSTINLNGGTLAAGPLIGGADSGLFLRGGSLKPAANVLVGRLFVEAAGAQGFLHEGLRTVRADQLFVGFGQVGAMTVRGEAQVESQVAGIGVLAGGRGEVLVEGQGTRWRNSGNLVVGGNAVGQLTVRDGAQVQTANAVLGGPATTSGWFQGPAGQGSVQVSGAGSALLASGDVSVGGDAATAGGRSWLEVADGGLVQVGGMLTVWNQGTVLVQGGTLVAGMLDNRGTLTGVGTVQASVFNRGRLAPGLSPGALVLAGDFRQGADGTLDIELVDAWTHDQLAIEGAALLGGTLALSCPTGCQFEAGQSLQLLFAAGGVQGSFEQVSFGSLNPGAFALVYGSDDVRLQVLASVTMAAGGGGLPPVPEPSTYAMLLLGLGGLGVLARRRARQQGTAPLN